MDGSRRPRQRRAGSRFRLKHPDARTLPDVFEWGYEGVGPGVLADRLGFSLDLPVSMAFAREVVARSSASSS